MKQITIVYDLCHVDVDPFITPEIVFLSYQGWHVRHRIGDAEGKRISTSA